MYVLIVKNYVYWWAERAFGHLFVVEFCNDIISGLMNDINASIFGEDIIKHRR